MLKDRAFETRVPHHHHHQHKNTDKYFWRRVGSRADMAAEAKEEKTIMMTSLARTKNRRFDPDDKSRSRSFGNGGGGSFREQSVVLN